MSHILSITTGDIDGVGLEVAVKALLQHRAAKGFNFVLWRAPKAQAALVKRLDRFFKRVSVRDPRQVSPGVSSRILYDLESTEPPCAWVEHSARECVSKTWSALVTGPLSKTEIRKAGRNDIGHTEILMRLTGVRHVNMGFIGSKMAVVLATGHLPLEQVRSNLNFETLSQAIWAADQLRQLLPANRRKRPIGLLGLNPHAGESGLLGEEERLLHGPVLEKLGSQIKLSGPIPPDTAFIPVQLEAHSVFVANYHDQGLIPFKTLHGMNEGVHISLGLPIIRTSVDHGTAKELFGKNKASAGSMLQALKLAIQMAKSRS